MNMQAMSVDGNEAKSLEEMTKRIRVDRGRGISVQEADKSGIDKLEGRKWIGGF